MTPTQGLIRVIDLADRQGISVRAFRKWLRRRDVPLERIGTEDYVFLTDLIRCIPALLESDELAAKLRAA